jgi:hypothetical protein
MDVASSKRSGHHARQWSTLEGALQRPLRVDERTNRLIKGVALILLVLVAVGLLVLATLALVGLGSRLI